MESNNGISHVESLPIIDISEITGSNKGPNLHSTAASKIVKDIRNSCLRWGFFYLVGHGIRSELVEDLRKILLEFFQLPTEAKNAVHRQPDNYRGFTASELTKQKQDWKQCFDFGAEYPSEVNTIENGIDLDAGKNQWPESIPDFKDTLLQYYSAMHSLSSILMDLIFMSLDVDPRTMRHHFNKTSDTSFCRLNYYPVYPDTVVDRLGVGPHSDAGVLTVLLQDNGVSSLQVLKDGKFHDARPLPGSFVINIGDMMQVWSNGLYSAPVHRVLANPHKERFSVPFFFNPSYKTNVEPLGQCVSNDRPPRYRSVNWGVFRQGRISGDYADYGEEIQIHHFEI